LVKPLLLAARAVKVARHHAAVVGGEHHQRLGAVALVLLGDLVEQTAELLVGELGGAPHVHLVAGVVLAVDRRRDVERGAKLMRRLIDCTHRHIHATPRLLVHHGERGVGDPGVAAEVRRIGAGREVTAVARVEPRRKRGRSAEIRLAVDEKATARRLADVRGHILAGGKAISTAERRLARLTGVGARRHSHSDIGRGRGGGLDGVALLADDNERRARKLRVHIISELGVLDESREVGQRQIAREMKRIDAKAEQIVGIAQHGVCPAHVARQLARNDDIVRNHSFRAHVSEHRLLEPDARVAQALKIGHREGVGVLRNHLVEKNDQYFVRFEWRRCLCR
jgi:hypothetical protein